jgi:hypothetical protein
MLKMNLNSTEIYIKNQRQIKLMMRISPWFDDKDDATNWYLYQKLSYFGGMTAEEVLIQNGINGYESLMKYINKKELNQL